MSQTDSRVPNSGYPVSHPLQMDHNSKYNAQEGNSTAIQLLASSTFSGAAKTVVVNNPSCRGAMFIWDVANFQTASMSGAMKITVTDPGRGTVYKLGSTPGTSASGVAMLMFMAGATVTAGPNTVISQPLPKNFNATISLSAAGAPAGSAGITCSLTMWLLK